MEQHQKAAEYVFKRGLQFGLVLIVINLAKFYFRLEGISIMMSSFMWLAGVILYFAVVAYVIKKVRDSIFDGYLGFRQCLSYGSSVVLFAALGASVISFIYFSWVDPYYLEWQTQMARELIMDFNSKLPLAAEDRETINALYENMETPGAFSGASGQFISNISLGFIVGLVTALIFKRKKPVKTTE